MSKTAFIQYKNCGFWIYDVAQGIFLKHLIDVSNRYLEHTDAGWLRDNIRSWRVSAVVGDFGIDFEELRSDEQITVLKVLILEVCHTLSKRSTITASEAFSWDILDGKGVRTRGDPEVSTGPVVELGYAILALLEGTLPSPPPNTWWCFGTSAGRTTIQIRNS